MKKIIPERIIESCLACDYENEGYCRNLHLHLQPMDLPIPIVCPLDDYIVPVQESCRECRGSGQVVDKSRNISIHLCPICKGTGKEESHERESI